MTKLSNAKAAVFGALALSLVGIAGVAGATPAPTDPLEDAVSTVQDQLVGYAVPIGGALVAVGLAFVAVKLIPKVIRFVGSRL